MNQEEENDFDSRLQGGSIESPAARKIMELTRRGLRTRPRDAVARLYMERGVCNFLWDRENEWQAYNFDTSSSLRKDVHRVFLGRQ